MNENLTSPFPGLITRDWDHTHKPNVGSSWSFQRDRLGFLERLHAHGRVVPFSLFGRKIWLISEPEYIEQVLVTQNKSFIKHFGLRYLSRFIGNGLLVNEGKSWLHQRRRMQSSFLPQVIQQFGPLMVEQAERFSANWQDGQIIDLHQELSRLTLAIVTRALFATNVDTESTEVYHVLHQALQATNRRFGSRFKFPMWLPTLQNLRIGKAFVRLRDLIARIIQERLQQGLQGKDLLTQLLKARAEQGDEGMTPKQLEDEVLTLFLAGHGTTANALTWTIYRLSQSPEVLRKMQAEWRDAIGERPITEKDVPYLRYTQAVIQESLRLDPPAYLMGRDAIEDVQLGEYVVRKGETVLLSQWVVHRDASWYPNPLEFQPERWLTQENPGRFTYFPFGAGPRVCIGNSFALLEFPLILATLLRSWDLQLITTAVQPWPLVTLRPKGVIQVKVGKAH